jgi:hypothetical protein
MTPIEQFSSTIDWRFDRYDIDRLGFLINRSISIDQLDRLIEIEIESINRIDQVDQSIDFQPCLKPGHASWSPHCRHPTTNDTGTTKAPAAASELVSFCTLTQDDPKVHSYANEAVEAIITSSCIRRAFSSHS